LIINSQIQTGWSNSLDCGFTATNIPGIPNVPKLPVNNNSLTEFVTSYTKSPGPFCAKDSDLEYLAHVNTPNLVRDLDLIRNLSGFDTLDFFGFEDGGSITGATYAAMFPDRVGKIVLDGMTQCTAANFNS
jgi:pimeloyl-ACP methyl ester carboxylesterase